MNWLELLDKKQLFKTGELRTNRISKWLRISYIFLTIVIIIFSSSCYKETKYVKPNVAVPGDYRGYPDKNMNLIAPLESGKNLGDLFWWELVEDDVLKELIQIAIVNNYDVRIAVEKIQAARANVGIARANQYPSVNNVEEYSAAKVSRVGATPIPSNTSDKTQYYSASLQAYFELDFWGRLKKTTEAARYDLLATEESKNTVLLTLVSEVASSYFTLRELDLELEISKKTLESRNESYKLVKARQEGYIATMMDVDQSLGLVYDAQKTITATEQQIQLQENYLSYLLGKNPQDIKRGKPLSGQLKEPIVPPGLPSNVLANRPDIRMAEQQLIASGIRVDIARLGYYPKITLTGAGGTLSKDLVNLFSGPSSTWAFLPQLTLPVYTAGSIRSQIYYSESQQRQAVLTYEQTVKLAFKDVSDSLISYGKSHQYKLQQRDLTNTLKDQSRLANLRYLGGVTSYLEVLDTERQYFQSELELAKSELNEYLNIIKLYKALGGGWKQCPEPPTAPAPSTTPVPEKSKVSKDAGTKDIAK
jgi:multidrug efflux system outer membrane protein